MINHSKLDILNQVLRLDSGKNLIFFDFFLKNTDVETSTLNIILVNIVKREEGYTGMFIISFMNTIIAIICALILNENQKF